MPGCTWPFIGGSRSGAGLEALDPGSDQACGVFVDQFGAEVWHFLGGAGIHPQVEYRASGLAGVDDLGAADAHVAFAGRLTTSARVLEGGLVA